MSEQESHHSVSEWLTTVNTSAGEAETAWQQLWDRYAPQVLVLACERMTHARKPLLDESDGVVDVFQDLFRGVQAGRFPRLNNRDELQRLLRTITQRRAIDAARRNGGRGHREEGESAGPATDSELSGNSPLEQVAAASPAPEFTLVACETLAQLLDSLGDQTLRQVALMRVLAATDEEIAAAIRVSVRTVQRKVRAVAQRWQQVVAAEGISLGELRQSFDTWPGVERDADGRS